MLLYNTFNLNHYYGWITRCSRKLCCSSKTNKKIHNFNISLSLSLISDVDTTAMGTKDSGPHEVGFTTSGWHISRKIGYILAALAVAACVLVGLIVYHVGVSGLTCEDIDGGGSTSASATGSGSTSGGSGSGHKGKEKVIEPTI